MTTADRSTPLRAALALVLMVASAGCASTPGGSTAGPGSEPRRLIFVVADGAGTSTWSLARLAREDDLAVARMPVGGLVDTREVNGGITDSAAGATAYSIGARTFNGAIGVDARCAEMWARDSVAVLGNPERCSPRETLLEAAESAGLSTGLVTTTVVTDATPAAFAAHVPERYMFDHIAPQMLASGVDVLLGGGRAIFDGTGEVSAGDLLSAACAEADCPRDAAELRALRRSDRRLIGLFAALEMVAAPERAPDLPTMAEVALDRLARNPRGFFLLLETEGTDSGQHANEPIAVIREEIAQLDRAIGVALDFAERTPGTLVVVASDHETGGMALSRARGEWVVAYTGGGHTGSMVPLFAYGPGAERFGGIHDNDEVGRMLRSWLLDGGR